MLWEEHAQAEVDEGFHRNETTKEQFHICFDKNPYLIARDYVILERK